MMIEDEKGLVIFKETVLSGLSEDLNPDFAWRE
jgi:hypothetical protein